MDSRFARALDRCPLYFILDRSICADNDPVEVGIEALSAGIAIMQLRLKGLTEEELATIARNLKSRWNETEWILIVNDSVEAALASGADGVHLGEQDMPVAEARRTGPELIIGATARTADSALRAEADGADYLGCGSVFPSQTKPGLPVIGTEGIREICGKVDIPVVGIGGIDRDSAAAVMGAGARGFCSVGLYVAGRSIAEVTRELCAAATGNQGGARGA